MEIISGVNSALGNQLSFARRNVAKTRFTRFFKDCTFDLLKVTDNATFTGRCNVAPSPFFKNYISRHMIHKKSSRTFYKVLFDECLNDCHRSTQRTPPKLLLSAMTENYRFNPQSDVFDVTPSWRCSPQPQHTVLPPIVSHM